MMSTRTPPSVSVLGFLQLWVCILMSGLSFPEASTEWLTENQKDLLGLCLSGAEATPDVAG